MNRRTPLFLLAVALGVSLGGAPAPAAPEETLEERLKPGHCPCAQGKACWHFLRTPLRVPEDPCRCGFCRSGGNCSSKERPDGWSAACMGSQKEECFWKRHAASWGISCAACVADVECDACNPILQLPNAELAAELKRQTELETGTSKRKVAVGWTKHFYLVTDMPNLKLLTQEGGPRVAHHHALVHLCLQRAEKARDDFTSVWGDEVSQGKPMAIYLANRRSQRDAWQGAYFGNPRTNMVFGGGAGRIAGGFCWNGFALSADEHNTDRDLHAAVRHMIGHILFSCWHGVNGHTKTCPKWAFAGVADWLCKIDPLFVDHTVFCHDEGTGGPSGTPKDWDKRAAAIAAGKRDPIERLFGLASLSHMSHGDLVRSWSYMDVMLREDRERWLAVMRSLRDGEEHQTAFQKGLGMTPDQFDARWAERLTGKRRSMSDQPSDAGDEEDGPNAAQRRRIRAETDETLLAALLRGLDRVTDVKTADLVLSKLAMDSDLIRETVVVLFLKTEKPEIVDFLREKGLAGGPSIERAYVARILGELKHAPARPALEAMLSDPHWLARANAAQALSRIGDAASLPLLVSQLEDDNPKAWISKADAVAGFGKVAAKATLPLASRLAAPDWQVRLTACRALAACGDKDAMDPLIERLATEGGRLKREIHSALKAVSGETFSDNAQAWRDWWNRQKPRGLPPKLEQPVEDPNYAPPKREPEEPHYYGQRIFSQSVGFVIDVSKSMETQIVIPPDALEKFGPLKSGLRIDVAKQAVIQAIQKLDPRTRMNIVFFSTRVRPWKDGLVPAGGARESAIGAIKAAGLEEETNIYGALRAAVGLHEKPTLGAQLDPIPDTIYFMTDGTPTRGEITDTDTILSWMRDVNRFAKVELHIIAMGNMGVDLPFLQRLADENGGTFTHVPG
jgi:HEAT repeat protein